MKVTWNTKSKHSFKPLEEREESHCALWHDDPGKKGGSYFDRFLCTGGGVKPPCERFKECSGCEPPAFKDPFSIPAEELTVKMPRAGISNRRTVQSAWYKTNADAVRSCLKYDELTHVADIRDMLPRLTADVIHRALSHLKVRLQADNPEIGYWKLIGSRN